MDADCIENQRDQLSSRRKSRRWSMNSQRLEEIVAVLLRPISSDARRCFDTDLTALLEEYLTEAGLHALDAAEDAPAVDAVAPNYAELALLLQQSATIYGRKVDFLYIQVLEVSESLHSNTIQASQEEPSPARVARPARRRPSQPRADAGFDFVNDVRDPTRYARDRAAPRSHPTLPRLFVELEPRVITNADPPLYDYAGELIGLLDDCQASVDLSHTMMLVGDDFEARTSRAQRALRPISMVELQAAIEAAAPPPLSPASPPPASPLATPPATPPASPPPSPMHTSTPLPPAEEDPTVPPDTSGEPVPPVVKPDLPVVKSRRTKTNLKRKHNGLIHLEEFFKIIIREELRQQSIRVPEFSLPAKWITRVINVRRIEILRHRKELRQLNPDPRLEFPGWSSAEAASATAKAMYARAGELDSDDDGFFDQTSSVGDSGDGSRADVTRADATRADVTRADVSRADASDWAAWQVGVLARVQQEEARGPPDVRALAAAVLRALPPAPATPAPATPAPPAPVPFADVLRSTARRDAEVSHVLLATLFLANAGNVDVLEGAPLSVDSFSLQLRSDDERLYSAAAAADDQFLR